MLCAIDLLYPSIHPLGCRTPALREPRPFLELEKQNVVYAMLRRVILNAMVSLKKTRTGDQLDDFARNPTEPPDEQKVAMLQNAHNPFT